MSSVYFDSSVLIAAWKKDDAFHSQAIALLNHFDTIIILDYILAETVTVLKMRTDMCCTQDFVDHVIRSDTFSIEHIDKTEWANVLSFSMKYSKLSFVDSLLLYKKHIGVGTIVTFDEALSKECKKY